MPMFLRGLTDLAYIQGECAEADLGEIKCLKALVKMSISVPMVLGLFYFLSIVIWRKLMLVHSTLDNLENGEVNEHVHAVELVPRGSDLPYRYVSGSFTL